MDKDVNKVVSLASYRAKEPVVIHTYDIAFEADGSSVVYNYMTFAHVLNVPESEDIWPGDAAELFYPELFACWLSGDEYLRVHDGAINEHKRCEILRLCHASFLRTSYFEYDFDRCKENGSFPVSLFGDGGDDRDTLNSELLLTEEYIPPEELLFGKKPTDGWSV